MNGFSAAQAIISAMIAPALLPGLGVADRHGNHAGP
jgi:hypothetical protein